MYRTILVPLDGSARAERILPYVKELAEKTGARVVLLRVAIDDDPVNVPIEMRATVAGHNRPVDHGDPSAQAHDYLETKQMQMRSGKFAVDIRVQEGPIVQGIIDAAETENADLIAIASHGRSGLGHIFYGSIASGVLNRIDRPLLIIRSGEDQPA